jgi:aarF domain-containing kinase
MTGNWASRSLVDDTGLGFSERLVNAWKHFIFRFVLFSSDIVFYASKIRQTFGFGDGMEDDIEKQMRYMAKDLGIELQHSVFEG